MKPDPARQLMIKSAGNVGDMTTTMMPANSVAAPISIGFRTPIRSIRRPTATEKVIGNSASSDSRTPTVNGEASRCNANNDSVTRAPAYARCSVIVNSRTKGSVTEKGASQSGRRHGGNRDFTCVAAQFRCAASDCALRGSSVYSFAPNQRHCDACTTRVLPQRQEHSFSAYESQ